MTTPALKQQTSQDEADILALIESVQRAHHAKDAVAIAAPFGPQAAIFSLAPPLAHRGVDIDEKKTWLDTREGPIDLETRDLHITVSGDSAFGWSCPEN
jgi:ketosteroid isomerase-like protein